MINVIRDVSAPASLAAQKSHRGSDVIEALSQVFKNKCYLTEKVFDSPNEMEVDHFLTQSERPDLIYAWDNLYAIEQKANKKRPKQTPVGGYLDPCDPADDVEREIIYVVEFGGNSLFKARNDKNSKAVNTAALLNHLHKDLKQAVKDRHHQVVCAVSEWYHAKKEGNGDEEMKQELILRKLLSRDSSYTMLMRSIRTVPVEFFD